MSDEITTDRPASHELYYAAHEVKALIPALDSLIESAEVNISEEAKREIQESLYKAEDRLTEAIAAFEEEEGREKIDEKRHANALAAFGGITSKENASYDSWHDLYVRLLKKRFKTDKAPSYHVLRAHYDAGKTPLQALGFQ